MKIGVLGGGQLGKMLAEAGKPLGHEFVFLDPSPEACAREHGAHIVGAFDDGASLEQLAEQCDVVTYEFENLPLKSVEQVADITTVYPSTEALRITQDRLFEKEFCQELGVPCAEYVAVPNPDAVEPAGATLGFPCILKTRRLGYDGKGQVFLKSEDDIPEAKELAATQECILEKVVPFTKECSIVCTRSQDGNIALYPLAENTHREGILRVSVAPADVAETTVDQARNIATKVLERLAYVGTLAVELFVLPDGSVAINEFAPRVHNSGHWSIEGAETSQFENHIRAITGMEPGSTTPRGHSVMINIIGTVPDLSTLESDNDIHIHLYGKSERPGRKIGHITVCSSGPSVVAQKAKAIETLCE